ncbi:unnamed protein product [Protopolystoma xenopodis]|uniref:Helix-turn-helix domain-containing protein n=1 Tax=Protopolystoma xenopodis TaxID=117903 RepID=A0A448XFC0_9PLAT|nr:unnamed protein product [Protopolystoma xenopodis]
MEVEEGERLLFLDVDVIRSNRTLEKNLFRKKSYAEIILNFRSHHNYRLKIGIMRSIIFQSLRLTDADFWDEELDKVTRIFLGNGYPNKVTQRNIRALDASSNTPTHCSNSTGLKGAITKTLPVADPVAESTDALTENDGASSPGFYQIHVKPIFDAEGRMSACVIFLSRDPNSLLSISLTENDILPLNVKYVVLTVRLFSRVNDSFRIRSVSRMSSNRSNIASMALTAFSPEMFVYMDCTSKLTNSSYPTNPRFWIL